MQPITDISALEALYPKASDRSLTKVAHAMTPLYRAWIGASRFVVLSTVGPEGTDASPRGDDGAVVRIADDRTLLLPDWRGNNRLDSLRNIVRDGRVSLMFMVPGCENIVRINGTALLTDDPNLRRSFARAGREPATIINVTIGEMYFQCAKALMRSRLWGETPKPDLPTAGDFLREMAPGFDGTAYDADYSDQARDRLW